MSPGQIRLTPPRPSHTYTFSLWCSAQPPSPHDSLAGLCPGHKTCWFCLRFSWWRTHGDVPARWKTAVVSLLYIEEAERRNDKWNPGQSRALNLGFQSPKPTLQTLNCLSPLLSWPSLRKGFGYLQTHNSYSCMKPPVPKHLTDNVLVPGPSHLRKEAQIRELKLFKSTTTCYKERSCLQGAVCIVPVTYHGVLSWSSPYLFTLVRYEPCSGKEAV